MVDTVTEQWVYPPNWDGNAPDNNGWKRVTKRFTCVSDGTGETDVIKVKIADLRTTVGEICTRTVIESIKFSQTGFTRIVLNWDRAPLSLIYIITENNGFINFKRNGGLVDPGEDGDRTGNIILTSTGFDLGDVYDITICLRLK